MLYRLALILGLVVTLTFISFPTEPADACCAVYRSGEPVVNADQTVILVWDAANKTQHFIRQASFKGDADDFGFLVPSPSQPELAEAGDDAFPYLRKLTEPDVQKRLRPWVMSCGCSAAIPDRHADWGALEVKVLEEKLVAGFNAAVLETKSSAALVKWLTDHGYVFSPEVEAWAKPYVEAGWKITALKVAKGKDARDKKTSAAALRMTFKTDRPLFPYREPKYDGTNEKVGARDRLLRIYFLAEQRYEGEITKDTPWTGKVVWAGKLEPRVGSKILEHLNLPPNIGPAAWWLTEFEDQWSYKLAPGDVVFRPSASQAEVRRPAIIQYVSTRFPADGALYALVAVAVACPLLVRLRRRVS